MSANKFSVLRLRLRLTFRLQNISFQLMRADGLKCINVSQA